MQRFIRQWTSAFDSFSVFQTYSRKRRTRPSSRPSLALGYPPQSKTFQTRASAEQWAREVEHEMDRGTFVSRAEADSTALGELLERYLMEVTPLKKGVAAEAVRIRALVRHPLSQRIVSSIRGVDIARWRDERLKQVSGATVKRDFVVLSHVFEVARKEWGIQVHNPVRAT